MDVYLDTERLALRRFTANDADLLIELDSDPAVMRYLTGGAPTAPEVIRERDLPSILAGYEKWGGQLGLFAAHEKDTGAFIGWFTVRPEPGGPPNEVELGYRLRQAAWGRGYATEGSRALCQRRLKTDPVASGENGPPPVGQSSVWVGVTRPRSRFLSR